MARVKRLLISVALFAFVCGACDVFAGEIGTIVLKDGTRHEMVTYTVNPNFYSIEIQDSTSQYNVSFSSIKAIFDAGGNDITYSVIGRGERPEADGEDWKLKNSKEYREARKLRWKAAISFVGGYDVPVGDYYTGVKAGPSFGMNLRIAFTDEIAGRLTVGMSGMEFESSPINLSAWRVLIGAEYYKPMSKGSGNRSFYYLQSTLGIIAHDMRLGTLSDTETRFTSSFGFGVVPMLGNSLGLEMSVDLDGVWTRERFSYDGADYQSFGINGWIIDLRAGLLFFL